MDKLKQLEIKKLIKELDYMESDFEYKSEIIVINDSKFMVDVNIFLEKNPQLKEIFDKKINDRISSIIKENESENLNIVEPDEQIENDKEADTISEERIEDFTDDKSPKIKNLYRDIVKVTHPDRTSDKKLNDLYIKSTLMYDNNDLAGIYSVCSELKIEYEIDEIDANNINSKIKSLRDKMIFIDSTFTFKWACAKNQIEKDQLVFLYIKTMLSN